MKSIQPLYQHPGIYFGTRILPQLGFTPAQVASSHWPLAEMEAFIAGTRDIDRDLAARLGRMVGIDAEIWEALQFAHDTGGLIELEPLDEPETQAT